MQPRYSVDSDNRLIIKKGKQRLAVDGSFSTDKNNRLIYRLNQPQNWRRKYRLPGKVVFDGKWKLNSNYDLELNLNKANEHPCVDRLVLKGDIISADKDAFVFEIISYMRQGRDTSSHTRLIKISGFWQADEANRINFVVKKDASADILTLTGGWQLNQNQQVAYTYEKTNLRTKTKTTTTLIFCGLWQINAAQRLTYIISRSSNSVLDFKVQLETPNVYPKEGVIRYRVGIGLKGLKPQKFKTISLYGTWKFNRVLGLIFEMEYAKGKIHSLEFSAEINFSRKDYIIFGLKDKTGESLGLNVIFSHRFLKKLDADLFLRLKYAQHDRSIEAGINMPF